MLIVTKNITLAGVGAGRDNYGRGYPAQRNTAYQTTYYLTEP
jgi:hypothetical protein